MENVLHVCLTRIVIIHNGKLRPVSCLVCRVWSSKLTHRLYVPQALQMLHVHQIDEQLPRATTLVGRNFKDNCIFYVAWFDSGTTESIGQWYQCVVLQQ